MFLHYIISVLIMSGVGFVIGISFKSMSVLAVVLYIVLLAISHLFGDRESRYVCMHSMGNGYVKDRSWWEL